ncbi:MAG: hypothetical protein ACFE96_17250 [Candidatus Hermodarchaeota archaeon]
MQKALLVGNLEVVRATEAIKNIEQSVEKLNEFLSQGWKVVSNAPLGNANASLVILEK